jgi:NADH:ubiquinone oxidoreductase subunit D
MRTPSFGNLQALPRGVEGGALADIITTLGSLDIVLGDVDR